MFCAGHQRSEEEKNKEDFPLSFNAPDVQCEYELVVNRTCGIARDIVISIFTRSLADKTRRAQRCVINTTQCHAEANKTGNTKSQDLGEIVHQPKQYINLERRPIALTHSAINNCCVRLPHQSDSIDFSIHDTGCSRNIKC